MDQAYVKDSDAQRVIAEILKLAHAYAAERDEALAEAQRLRGELERYRGTV